MLVVHCDRVGLTPLCPINVPCSPRARCLCCVRLINSHLHALTTPAPCIWLVISTSLPAGQYPRHYLIGLLGSHSLLEATSSTSNRELVIHVCLSCTERSSYSYFNIYSRRREIIRRWRKHEKNKAMNLKEWNVSENLVTFLHNGSYSELNICRHFLNNGEPVTSRDSNGSICCQW